MSSSIDVNTVNWDDTQAVLMQLRKTVFVDEQHVPEELEWDGLDDACTQFLATMDGQPVGTARLTPEGQIGRMAVLISHRRKGIGSQLLEAAIQAAVAAGFSEVFLHAQVNVIKFYQQHGFTAEGDIFMDAGIEHRNMKMVL